MQIKREWKCHVWWCTPVIPALRRLKQENIEFEDILGYTKTFVKRQTPKRKKRVE
jgi:hypothetical protein